MGLNGTNFQQLVIASLSNADPDALEMLQTNVPLYWALFARQAYLPELRYWYTRREGIKLLMGCLNKQIDYIRRTQNNTRNSIESSLADSTALAESNSNMNALSVRSSLGQSESESNSTGGATNSGNQSANQTQVSEMFMDDTGAGDSLQSRISHQLTQTKDESDVEEHVQQKLSENIMRHERLPANNKGDHSLITTQNITYSLFDPAAVGVPLGGAPIGVQNLTETESHSTTHNESTDDVYATTKNSSGDEPIRKSTTDMIVRVVAVRSVDMNMYDVPTKADGTPDTSPASIDPDSLLSRKSSHSDFTANVVSLDAASTFSGSAGRTISQSNTNSDRVGSTISLAEGNSISESSAIATRIGEGTGLSERSTQAQGQMNSLMEKLNQRFKHLQELWANANEMIKWFESQRLVISPYTIQLITTQYPDGVSVQVANQLLITQPQ